MQNFKAYFLYESAKDQYQTVSNYVEQLLKSTPVHIDDFETVIRMIKNRLKQADPSAAYGIFADYKPLLDKLMNAMSPEDKGDAQGLIQKHMDIGDLPERLSVFGITRPNINMEKFTDIIHNAMDGKYSVPVMQKFVDEYKDQWELLDDNLKAQFLDWMHQKLKQMQNQPTIAQMIADILRKLEKDPNQ
jgi:hypothetical protein